MNNQLIEKVIKANNDDCPRFLFKNPLLDRNVASALSSSFVKILSASDQNSKMNNNLRFSILENIRRMCQIEPENHVNVDDTLIQSLTELYQRHTLEASSTNSDSVERQLDAFLIRRFTEMDINPMYPSNVNPEVIQALINLNDKGVYLDLLSKDIIHWQIRNENMEFPFKTLNDLWTRKLAEQYGSNIYDDIALKMRPQIENQLLRICLEILSTRLDLKSVFGTPQLADLVNKCSSSPICFQICAGILNFIFIMTNFDMQMQIFIEMFVKKIKSNSTGAVILLYPKHMSSIVIALDTNISDLPAALKEPLVKTSLKYLRKLHLESESDLILLLSHFPQWFDIYFTWPDDN